MDKINVQRNNLEKQNEEEDDERIILAEQAHNLLIEGELFRNENLSRDKLAVALGTNRQYLIDAIREKTGQTYKDYINSIRLNYAYKRLVKEMDTSIEKTYMDAGFISKSTFYRLFKEQYGMTPNELREVARKEEQLIISSDIKP